MKGYPDQFVLAVDQPRTTTNPDTLSIETFRKAGQDLEIHSTEYVFVRGDTTQPPTNT